MVKIQIIGMGEIGEQIALSMIDKSEEDYFRFVDIVEKELPSGLKTQTEIEEADVHIISVYTTDQIFDVLDQIPIGINKPLISIESTIDPNAIERLRDFCEYTKNDCDVVVFPHRYNPNDEEHKCFNLNRIMGSPLTKSLIRGYYFWKKWFDEDNRIKLVSYEVSVLSKLVENSYRFMEIAIAQELKTCCDKFDIDFEDLRESVNTKWNIELKEARDGIGGKCLPKDSELLSSYFKESNILNETIKSNNKYKNGE